MMRTRTVLPILLLGIASVSGSSLATVPDSFALDAKEVVVSVKISELAGSRDKYRASGILRHLRVVAAKAVADAGSDLKIRDGSASAFCRMPPQDDDFEESDPRRHRIQTQLVVESDPARPEDGIVVKVQSCRLISNGSYGKQTFGRHLTTRFVYRGSYAQVSRLAIDCRVARCMDKRIAGEAYGVFSALASTSG